jgi:tetratricopeptide (TPR) repeat protein
MPKALWTLLTITATTLLFTACLSRPVERQPTATPQPSPTHEQGIFHHTRALARLAQADYDNAVADMDKARKLIDPQLMHLYTHEMHQVYFQSGVAYYDTGLYDDAIILFDKAIDVVPMPSDYLAAYFQRGMSHFRKGSYRRAIADFDMLIGLEQDYPNAAHYRQLAQKRLSE